LSVWRYTIDGRDVAKVDDSIWKGPDDEPLSLTGPNDIRHIESSPSDLARYAALLPIDLEHFQTLGAGMTPLIEGRLAGHPVMFKLDSLLPTGSFKDRGAAVAVALIKARGIDRIAVDSSGNAAASMAAFCAASGIDCTVYAPLIASPGKLVQAEAYGARLELVDGPRQAVADAAQSAGENDSSVSYVSHNWSPVFAEGVKTWALEVWEQLGRQSPRRVFVPTGGGSAFIGAWRGFNATGAMPRLIACQPEACAPLVGAFNDGASRVASVEARHTIAEGARIAAPPRDGLLLQALRDSSGGAYAVNDDELQTALQELWRQGIYAEPTAALGAAAFRQAVSRGEVLDGTNVILITGHGLKATESIGNLLRQS
jgi:threonine synthase